MSTSMDADLAEIDAFAKEMQLTLPTDADLPEGGDLVTTLRHARALVDTMQADPASADETGAVQVAPLLETIGATIETLEEQFTALASNVRRG